MYFLFFRVVVIITNGRNDNYAGNFVQRLEHNINKLISNIDKLKIEDIEIIVTDWGSPEDSKLSDVMNVESRPYLKFLFIPKNITNKYSPDSNFSIPHAMNAAIRRSSGENIFCIDGDSYIPLQAFSKMYSFINERGRESYKFFWVTRVIIPYQEQILQNSIDDMDRLIKYWSDGGKKTVSHQEYLNGQGWLKSNVNIFKNHY